MIDWTTTFAQRTHRMRRSSIREILKLTAQPDMISFAGGLPAPELFPVDRFREAMDTVLAERGQDALQYSTTEGLPELRDLIAKRLSGCGLVVNADNILMVSGSQQALDLIGRVMLDEGDKVVIENPSYLGMLMAWNAYALDYLAIETDASGICVDKLPPLLKQQPKLVYVIPNFQNPGGHTMQANRRQQFVEMLAGSPVPVLEDDAYGELRYSGKPLPSLLQMDAQHMGLTELNGHIISIGTFSKTLSPGSRVAWIAAPMPVIDRLIKAKQSTDLHTSTFMQMVIYQVARDGFLDSHIERIREVYKQRRDGMLAAMSLHFPPEVTWTIPEGGLFLMVRMPEHIDALELLEEAIEHRVAFVPGADFHVGNVGANTFRLNFSNASPAMIEEGILRLGRLLKSRLH